MGSKDDARAIIVTTAAVTAAGDWGLKALAHRRDGVEIVTHVPAPWHLVLAVLAAAWMIRTAAGLEGSLPQPALYAIGLTVGGAVGNTGELIVRGGVTDFIRLGPSLASPADLAVVAGVVLLFAYARLLRVRLYRFVVRTVTGKGLVRGWGGFQEHRARTRAWRAEADLAAAPAHEVLVPATAGRPGARLLAYGRSFYESRDVPGARELFALVVGPQSLLKGVMFDDTRHESSAESAASTSNRLREQGWTVSAPAEEPLLGEPAVRYRATIGTTALTEWKLRHGGRLFAIGVLCRGGDDEAAALLRARAMLSTWQWVDAAGDAPRTPELIAR